MSILLALALSLAPARAEDVAADDAPASPPTVLVGPQLSGPTLVLPAAVRDQLGDRAWSAAASGLLKLDASKLSPEDKVRHAFLVAWCLTHADRGAEAEPFLAALTDVPGVPPSYLWTVKGEVLRALERNVDALAALEQVPPGAVISPRATVVRAEVLRELDRSKEAWALYEELAQRPDPAPGNAEALLGLAQHHGAGSVEAYPFLRRLWKEYPKTEQSIAGQKMLESYVDAKYRPTWQEVARRAEVLMDRQDWAGAVLEASRVSTQVTGDSLDACRFRFVLGRSQYKLNKLTESITAFGTNGADCSQVEIDYGARTLFLQGTAQYRKKQFAAAARSFLQIPELYPKSNFADDGYKEGGIALQENDDLAGAMAAWKKALDSYPQGDTVPESTWRLAWAQYLQGDTPSAIANAEVLAALPASGDPVMVAAGRYWAPRWRLYPDVSKPNEMVKDPAVKQVAIAQWRSLCETWPHSFYAIFAYARLRELAPDVAAELAKRAPDRDRGAAPQPWVVRLEFLDHPGMRAGVELARLGLLTEAKAEWEAMPKTELTPDEMAWLTELRIANGDWLFAHDSMRMWMKTHPAASLGDRRAQILRVAYPDRYWTEVQENSKGYSYDPRLLHALVREESNFNKDIVSFAGARGLSQLMPATAKQTAGWLGMTVTNDQLSDPATNLKIGAKYFDTVTDQFDGSPYLALAAYNAGGGRVNEWAGKWGDVPTDEYVERIPFKETRDYVKRVMGTWQTYRWQFDDGDAFYDLSAYNGHALKP